MKKTALHIFLSHLKKYRGYTILLLIVIGTAESMANTFTWYFSRIVNFMGTVQFPVTADIENMIWQQLELLFIMIFSAWILWRISGYIASIIQPGVAADLEKSAMKSLFTQTHSFYLDNFAGGLVRKVKGLSSGFTNLFEAFIWRIVVLIMGLGSIVIIISLRNIWLGLGILFGVSVVIGLNIYIFYMRRSYELQRAQKDSIVTGLLADDITNNLNIKLFAADTIETKNFSAAVDDRTDMVRKTWRIGEKNNFNLNVINILIEISLMLYCLRQWTIGQLVLGDFILVQSYLFSIFSKFFDLSKIIRTIYASLADAQEMVDIMNKVPEVLDSKTAQALIIQNSQIDFNHVSFQYHNEPVLKNFDLHITGGEKIALVGPSGAGKSTIIKLLLRLYNIQAGSITIDSQNLTDITQKSLWENTALVPQDPVLFHRSLRDNICYSNPQATEAEMITAAKKAHCHDFISKLEKGYDTFVGERGVKLSGGERQRVAIARAILKNAPILILDEATSSLDSESESLIQIALKNLMQNKTTIVIAHRLSTIMQMDRIIVIDHGKVVDTGTHTDLTRKDGLYQKLWSIQAGAFGEM